MPDLRYDLDKLCEAVDGNISHKHLAIVEGVYIDTILAEIERIEKIQVIDDSQIKRDLEEIRKFLKDSKTVNIKKSEAKHLARSVQYQMTEWCHPDIP